MPKRRLPVPTIALCLACGALLVSIAGIAGAKANQNEVVRADIEATSLTELAAHLEGLGYDVAGKNPETATISVITDRNSLRRLAQEVTSVGSHGGGKLMRVTASRPFREIAGSRAPEERYKDYTEVVAALDQVAATYPQIARKVDLTAEFGTAPTWDGRQIYALKISDNPELDEAEPVVLFDSLHHARELNTMEVTLDTIAWLTERYGTDPNATRWVDSLEIWVVPVVNPDGLEYVWSDEQFWRKNRRPNNDGTFGVDLNRNYPFQWGECGNNSGTPGSDVYRGPSENSEQEVQTMVALGEAIRPAIYISYHSSGREVLQPYTCADLAEPMIDTVRDLYRARMDYDWRLASSSGESFEWYYNQISSIAYLTEISTAFQPPFDETIDEVARVRPGWQLLLEVAAARGPLIQGTVVDADTLEPLAANITSSRVNFTEGERRSSDPDLGRFGWFLLPGLHDLTFSAPGYDAVTLPVDVILGGETIDVDLQPTDDAGAPR